MAGEMAEQFRASTILQQTWIWFLAPPSNGSQLPVTPAPGDPTPLSGLCEHYTHLFQTDTHIIKVKIKTLKIESSHTLLKEKPLQM